MDDLRHATDRDLYMAVAQKYNATVGGAMQEKIQGFSVGVERSARAIEAFFICCC